MSPLILPGDPVVRYACFLSLMQIANAMLRFQSDLESRLEYLSYTVEAYVLLTSKTRAACTSSF